MQIKIVHKKESYTLHVTQVGKDYRYSPMVDKRKKGEGPTPKSASVRNLQLMRELGIKDTGSSTQHSFLIPSKLA